MTIWVVETKVWRGWIARGGARGGGYSTTFNNARKALAKAQERNPDAELRIVPYQRVQTKEFTQ